MNWKSLVKYFRYAAIIPFCIVTVTGIILAIIHKQDPSYRSEYFASDGFGESIFIQVIFSLLVMILSYPLFFNSYKSVAGNFLLSMLCWILLPFILFAVVLYKYLESIQVTTLYEGNIVLDSFFVFIIMLHIVALLLSFYKFRKAMSLQHIRHTAIL